MRYTSHRAVDPEKAIYTQTRTISSYERDPHRELEYSCRRDYLTSVTSECLEVVRSRAFLNSSLRALTSESHRHHNNISFPSSSWLPVYSSELWTFAPKELNPTGYRFG